MRPKISDAAALRASRRSRNHALLERNQLLRLWLQASGLIAHLEPARKPDLLFPAVLCVHTPVGQLTWRLSHDDVEDFGHLPSNTVSHYDGAGSAEKDARLEQLTGLAIGPSRPSSAHFAGLLKGSPLTFAQADAIHTELVIALDAKASAGTYAAFVSPEGDKVRLTRYLPRFVARLPKDAADRLFDPKDGWLFAGTVEKA